MIVHTLYALETLPYNFPTRYTLHATRYTLHATRYTLHATRCILSVSYTIVFMIVGIILIHNKLQELCIFLIYTLYATFYTLSIYYELRN